MSKKLKIKGDCRRVFETHKERFDMFLIKSFVFTNEFSCIHQFFSEPEIHIIIQGETVLNFDTIF